MSRRAPGARANEPLGPEVRAVAIVVVVGAMMSILDTTIVNVALESLSRDLNAPLSTIQWVSTGYLLSLATVIPLTGWAAERFGPRRVWMVAVAGFAVTSAMCGLAWSAESLIAFRVLQGFAGGMIMPIGMITLAQTAGPQRVGAVMSVIGVPMLLAPVLGPVVGGLIVTHLDWRWIFFVNLPIGVVGLVLAARFMPAGRSEGEGTATLDWRGLLLLSPGLGLLVFGLSEVAAHGSVDLAAAGPFVAGVVLIAWFVWRSWRVESPLVDIQLFRGGGFSAAAATVTFAGAALFGALLLLPLYYQVARGESALVAGLLMTPQGVGAALGMNRAGRLTDRIGGGRVVVPGLLLLMLGTLPFTQVTADTSYWLLGAALFVRGFGLGFSMMPAMAAAYATLERAQVPRATPMLNVVQRVGGSVGTAVLAVVLQRELSSHVGAGASGGLEAARTAAGAGGERVAEPLAAAFGATYWWAMAMTALALVPAVALAVIERRAAAASAAEADAPVPAPMPPRPPDPRPAPGQAQAPLG